MNPSCILTINSGSSSLKFAVFTQGVMNLVGQFDRVKTPECNVRIKISENELIYEGLVSENNETVSHAICLKWIIDMLAKKNMHICAVGHRVVHGGLKYSDSVLLNREIIRDLEVLSTLAPLHQPHNLAGIMACGAHLPDVPQVACFDTAFHRDRPMIDRMYGIDKNLMETDGVMAYGFHGLSYTYIAEQLSQMETWHSRVAVCHLGNGSSVCGVLDGKGVTSSMGFTALDGVMMGTRSGRIDPGVVLYLVEKFGLEKATNMLYKESGLLGISGVSSDVRDLQNAGDAGDQGAVVAIEKFCWMVAKEISGMLPNLGGLDAIVFTAGIGERSNRIRDSICRKLSWLGIELDQSANSRNSFKISTDSSRVCVYIIPTDEEGVIARDTAKLAFA